MKKVTILILAITLISFMQLGVFCSNKSEYTTYLEETFDPPHSPESLPGQNVDGYNGWDRQTGSGRLDSDFTIITEEGTSNRVARFYRSESDNESMLYVVRKAFNKIDSGIASLKFRVKSLNGNSNRFMFYVIDSNNTISEFVIQFDHSRIATPAGNFFFNGAITNNTRVPVGQWFSFEVRYDFDNGSFTLYENNLLLCSPQGLGRNNGSMARVAFGTQRNSAGIGAEFYTDDWFVGRVNNFTIAESAPKNESAGVDVHTPIDLSFNNRIDLNSVDEASALLSSSTQGAAIPGVQSINFDTENLLNATILFDAPFDFNSQYTLEIRGFKDVFGQDISSGIISFTTRGRMLIAKNPKYYFADEDITETGFVEGVVTANIPIKNEYLESKTLTAIMALYDGEQLKDLICKDITIGAEDITQPEVELTLNTAGGDRLAIYFWDSLSDMSIICGEYTFDAEGSAEHPFVKGASADSIYIERDYDSGSVIFSGMAQDGTLPLLVLRPEYTLSGLTIDNAGEYIDYIAQIAGGNYETAYLPKTPAVMSKDYTVWASKAAHATFKFFDSDMIESVKRTIKDSNSDKLRDMLKKTNPHKLPEGFFINDVLTLNLDGYHSLLDPLPVLDALAGKAFQNVADIRDVFYTKVGIQTEYEVRVRALLTAANNALWDELEELFKENDDLLQLDWNGNYKNIGSYKTTLYKKLANDYTFDGLESIRKAFSKESDEIFSTKTEPANQKKSAGQTGSGATYSLPSAMPNKQDASLEVPTAPADELLPAEAKQPFSDLDCVPWAQEAIEQLAAEKIINGVSEGIFNPLGIVTREQFAKMLVLAFDMQIVEEQPPFIDIPLNTWYFPFVSTAYYNEIIVGVTDVLFGAGRGVTRAEMATMSVRAAKHFGLNLSDNGAVPKFLDSQDIPDYAVESVMTLYGAGIVNGIEGGRFAPADTATRDMAAKVIFELLKVKKQVQRGINVEY